MLFTSVSYVSLLLTVALKGSTFLWPPQNLNTLPSSSPQASVYFNFLWLLHKLFNIPLTFPFSLKPTPSTCDSPTQLHSTYRPYTYIALSPSV